MSLHNFEDLTREELGEFAPRALLILPVASIEQHGPHLPTVTDTAILTAVLDRACTAVAPEVDILRAPILCYGASDHHLYFGGTLSLTSQTFQAVLADLVRSAAKAGSKRVLIVNGHGGNASVCTTVAADASRIEGILIATCSYWELIELATGGHASQFETSLMLTIRPDLVHLDRARLSPSTLPAYQRGLYVCPADLWQKIDGFRGDPRQASAEFGEVLLSRCADALAAAIAELVAA